MTAEQCRTHKALEMYLPSPRCFLVPGPNNILSTSHSVLALPCQPHIIVMAIASLPPYPTHLNNDTASLPPSPRGTFSNWLYFWHVSVYFTCVEVTNPTSSTSPCANVHCDYLKMNRRPNSGHKLVCFCAVYSVLIVVFGAAVRLTTRLTNSCKYLSLYCTLQCN